MNDGSRERQNGRLGASCRVHWSGSVGGGLATTYEGEFAKPNGLFRPTQRRGSIPVDFDDWSRRLLDQFVAGIGVLVVLGVVALVSECRVKLFGGSDRPSPVVGNRHSPRSDIVPVKRDASRRDKAFDFVSDLLYRPK